MSPPGHRGHPGWQRDRIPAMATVNDPAVIGARSDSSSDPSLRITHLLLSVQSVVVVLVSVNRLTTLGKAYVLPNEFLRWLDLTNILLALASLLAFYLLQR